MLNHTKRILAAFVIASLVAGCSGLGGKYNAETPIDNKDQRRANRGKITGDEGFTLFGGKKGGSGGGSESPIGVNSFLWRATLDTLAFMPLARLNMCPTTP